MKTSLQYLLYALALVAIASGVNVIVGGAAAIPGANGSIVATADNELRFFAVFWVAYGSFCFWVGRNLAQQIMFVPPLALTFFVGGVARLMSVLQLGSPGLFLIVAMILEWLLPCLIMLLYRQYRRGTRSNDDVTDNAATSA